MKNIRINKKMLSVAICNAVLLMSNPTYTYADGLEIIDTVEVDKINDYVIANVDTEIKEKPFVFSDTVATITKGTTLKLLTDAEGYYEVLYKNEIGYVDRNTVSETTMKKGIYINNDTYIYADEEHKLPMIEAKKLDYYQVHDETDTNYRVKVADEVFGFIGKENCDELGDVYIVVDISDQNVTMYNHDLVLLSTPVVTGKNNRTQKGIFHIYNVTGARYLVGPNYRSYVHAMMKFDGNRGFHDAEYHIDPDGTKRGWRDISEFGGDTYITNGSHGCVNMPYDATMTMYNFVKPYVVDQGNEIKVLVKE